MLFRPSSVEIENQNQNRRPFTKKRYKPHGITHYYSDEATFYLRGLVNEYNVRYWPEDNPHATIETVMNYPKLNA